MEKRPLDTELEVLWSEHLEDDVFSVRAYNVLAHRLGLRTLGDILNLTRDDIAKALGKRPWTTLRSWFGRADTN